MSARLRVIGATLLLAASLAACDAASTSDGVASVPDGDVEQAAPVVPVRITTSAADLRAVRIAEPLRIKAPEGTLKAVAVTATDGTRLDGSIKGAVWQLSSRLEPTEVEVSAIGHAESLVGPR